MRKRRLFFGKIFPAICINLLLSGCGQSSDILNQTAINEQSDHTSQEATESDKTTESDKATETDKASESDKASDADNNTANNTFGTENSLENSQLSETDQKEESDTEDFLPGYETEQDFKDRHTGSVALINEPTVLVSIFIDEEEDVWTPEEKKTTLQTARIAYNYIEEELSKQNDTDVTLIYDWEENPDLLYSFRIYENIPAYVETEEERHIDELEAEWVAQIPYRDLLLKYDTTSIGFLYFIPHEGCSYSSNHFIEDGDFIWNEGCLLYLQDMYSPSYEYETPAVYAHELLHLFGAEDYYSSADVFSKETYKVLKNKCSNDLMYSTFDTINGVYTTYRDSIPRQISPVTLYLLGVGSEDAIEDMPELKREEPGCFPGSTFDRPF